MTSDSGELRNEPLTSLDRRYEQLRIPAPERVARLRRALARDAGLHEPVLVSDAVASGILVVVDGFKRLRALADSGATHVQVRVVHLDPVAAEVALVHANVGRPGLYPFEEAWVVRSLCREHGLQQAEVATRIGRCFSWVSRRLSLAEKLERTLQEDVRLGILSPTVARELARLPRGKQVPAARTVLEHGLSSRQTAQLVQVLAQADPATTAKALASPMEHLAPRGRSERPADDPELSQAANQARRALLQISSASQRLLELVLCRGRAGWSRRDAEVLGGLASAVELTVESALEAVLAATAPREQGGQEVG